MSQEDISEAFDDTQKIIISTTKLGGLNGTRYCTGVPGTNSGPATTPLAAIVG